MSYLQFKNYQKQILKMSSLNPNTRTSFQTPQRTTYPQQNQSNIHKTAQTRLQSSPQPVDYPIQNERHRTINVRISKTNYPYTNTPKYGSYGHPSEYIKYRPEQLLKIIEMYEYQIAILKDYIHHSDLVDRHRIVQIFGFETSHPQSIPNDQSKQVLKQLSTKIKHLIRQNSQLKTKTQVQTSPTRNLQTDRDLQETNLLIRQNQKLRMLIDQLKNSQNVDIQRLMGENQRLRSQNYALDDLVRKYKVKLDSMEEERGKMVESQVRPVIQEIKPIRTSSFNQNTQNVIQSQSKLQPPQVQTQPQPSKQQMQYTKKQLTKQMFQFSQQLQQRNKNNETKIDQLQKRIQQLENKIKLYEKQRKTRIDSTLRKSFLLTESVLKLRGDDHPEVDRDREIIQPEYLPRKEQGKIRTTSRFIMKKDEYEEKKPLDISMTSSHIVPNTVNQTNHQQEQLKRQLKQVSQKLLMQQMKNKNIVQQNNMLKKKLAQIEKQLMQKVERNIKLEGIISNLQKQKQSVGIKRINSTTNPQIEKQLKQIIEVLKSCTVSNFQLFFKEFNQILSQRKLFRDTIQSYKVTNDAITKSRMTKSPEQQKQSRTLLQQKVGQLMDENKRLINKVSELEAQVQRYHQQIINNQIQKLNSLKFGQTMLPNGEQAIQWQKIVRGSIEGALTRLYNLERKVAESSQGREMRTSVNQKPVSASEFRSLGPRQA